MINYIEIVLDDDGKFVCLQNELEHEIFIGTKIRNNIRISDDEILELPMLSDYIGDIEDGIKEEVNEEWNERYDSLSEAYEELKEENERLKKQVSTKRKRKRKEKCI